jgi:hypothetical protein
VLCNKTWETFIKKEELVVLVIAHVDLCGWVSGLHYPFPFKIPSNQYDMPSTTRRSLVYRGKINADSDSCIDSPNYPSLQWLAFIKSSWVNGNIAQLPLSLLVLVRRFREMET